VISSGVPKTNHDAFGSGRATAWGLSHRAVGYPWLILGSFLMLLCYRKLTYIEFDNAGLVVELTYVLDSTHEPGALDT
jgi:hypothetical protein